MEPTLTPEQQQALALASARLRLKQQVHQQQPQQAQSAPMQAGFDPMSIRNSPIAGGPLMALFGEASKSFEKDVAKGAYAGGGAVTDFATQKGASPEVAAGAGYATNVGIRAIPSLAGAVAGKLVEPVTRNAPVVGSRALMQSVLKPSSKDLASGDASKAIETFLNRGYSGTAGGVSKMRQVVSALSKDVDDIVAATPGNVDKNLVRAEVLEQLKKFRAQVNPNSDVDAVLKSWNEFKKTVPSNIPIQRAQEIKQGTYKILADKYSHLGTVGDEAGTQTQMAMARGLRKGIEGAAPAVVPKNKEMAELINAIEIGERRSGIAGNRDIAGIAWLAENPLAAAGSLADRSPWIKSLLARYMHSGMPATGAMGGAAYSVDKEREREAMIKALQTK